MKTVRDHIAGRAGWAVEAAEHMAAALRIIDDTSGLDAQLAREKTYWAYFRLLYSIGTVRDSRMAGEVYEATILREVAVADALDAIGA